ncbi:MAG: aminopeptidase P family protein [Planctomycetota bacterium]
MIGRALLSTFLLACACVGARAQEAPTQDAPAAPGVGDRLEALRAAAFAPERLAQRRARLVESLPEGAVVVVGSPAPTNDTWSYRPAPDFRYLSGLEESTVVLVLADGVDLAFAPARSRRHELWNGARLAPGTPQAKALGFEAVVDRAELTKRLRGLLDEEGAELYLSGVTAEDLGLGDHDAEPAGPAIAALRQVKDEAEVALLSHAIDATAAALTEAIRSLRPGLYEFEVQGVIEYLFTRYGAQREGFATIVGGGPNSCVLHYVKNRRRLEAGDLVVMDVGAEAYGYSADVTRTVPVSGTFTPRQREIYELVLRAQRAGIEAVKPGATVREVHRAAAKVIQDAGYGASFPHGTSHWLGLDVHDVGDYGRKLEPGMVLTVEPGIYLPEESLGVRIEDDVLVTETGHRVLSAGVPRDVEALEALLDREGLGNRPVTPLPGPPAAQGEDDEPRRF